MKKAFSFFDTIVIHIRYNHDTNSYYDLSNLDLLRMVKMCLVIEKGSHIK